ncbi:Mannan endo-1,6-alpha-mannosidase [Metarhizium rileyi]|uniref:Mannan endo-1,6-alpha-mannosidase n=1 Tax=Metarhizium rileyi (strain RCEF 4871) TaxID=1649241 RepID=A0A167BEK8_METRR|nr:Mannan endo-1,6-alpha-mannosidase [Metarhizium rileyi RCEF 4871]
MKGFATAVALSLALVGTPAYGLDVKIEDEASVKGTAATIAYGLMKYYTGNNTGDTPGNLPDPYYWWEAGAMFGTMIDYWHLTGDSSYNDATLQAMVHQAGDTKDFMPKNQTRTEGNDDQGFWAMAAMTAAENKFPDPPKDKAQWLALAQAVFNQYVLRWDPADCSGGMRWQIFQFNRGWNYKNSISNGCFFNIAARLHRYTGNSTYGDWATKVFEWEQSIKLITSDYGVHDGMSIDDDGTCTRMDTLEWSYNSGIFLHGAAAMYNATSDDKWKKAVDGILKHAVDKFFKDGVVYEQFCEFGQVCNNDQQSFKGYLLRWLAATTRLVPYTYDTIRPLLQKAGTAAATACTGSTAAPKFKGQPGTACGFSWIPQGKFDELVGVGAQMNALDAVMYNLVQKSSGPVTEKTGGTSKGDPSAGSGGTEDPTVLKPLKTPDKAGAGIITMLLIVGAIGGAAFMLLEFR